MKTKIITLAEPIEANGETVTQLIVEEPRAKHLRQLPVGKLTMGALLDLAAECSGIPPSSMDKLSGNDAMRVVEAVGDFLADGPGATAQA